MAIASEDRRWAALRWEGIRRFHVLRAWLGGELPAVLATARSGAVGEAALLLVRPLGGLRRSTRRRPGVVAAA